MVALMLAWLGSAMANPIAIRQGAPEQVTLTAGMPTTSLSWMSAAGWSVAASWQHLSAVGVDAGHDWIWNKAPERSWRVGMSGGLVVPLWSPGLAFRFSPHLQHQRSWGGIEHRVGLVSPMAIRPLPSPDLRLPCLVEDAWTVQAGPVSVGLLAGGGVVVHPGGGWSLAGHAALIVRSQL